ncbi:MAG: cofactor-independent phosphoglycerate mutase [Clostridiales bacterium]|nr:cofactor-independent phosphoglycerate mutase [Clostridiales bacterium]MCF8023239.1 cofactor-independent phosphoglycerate mutase [Clostridiales bacterium]
MKYIVILSDGMADEPCSVLNGKTPLQYASTPNMDFLASAGEVGTARTVPEGYPPGSDVANLSVMGYDPREYYTGRSPLEAVSMGIDLGPGDISFRCNLVTLSGEGSYEEKFMEDYCAGEISSEESGELIELINSKLGSSEHKFYPGVSYRHLMVLKGGNIEGNLTPPHDIHGQEILSYLPAGEGNEKLKQMMKDSYDLLNNHPVNMSRLDNSLNPANSIWLWGEGKKPSLASFTEKYNLRGAVISAVDLIKGIGMCANMEVVEVPGATGNVHTNFQGKAQAALKTLEQGADFIYIHLEAPDEAGHQGNLQDKITAIEEVDEKVLGKILKSLKGTEFKVMVLPDHPTPMRTRTHSTDPVPFVIYNSLNEKSTDKNFNEDTARECSLKLEYGYTLMDYFLGKTTCM